MKIYSEKIIESKRLTMFKKLFKVGDKVYYNALGQYEKGEIKKISKNGSVTVINPDIGGICILPIFNLVKD